MDDRFRQLLIETANSLGMNPVDLATIISYETGGSFDPTQGGPITKWGKHRGLIQFGEPQARQHGVDWKDPLNSQLGAGKAVEKYFRSSGWKPGMGMLDAYSIVNAGGPGRYDASDTAAGGAPGTVRDKVEQQMADDRRKAQNLLNMSPEAMAFVQNNPQPGGYGPDVPDPNAPPIFGSMSPNTGQQPPMMGPPPGAAQWALSGDKPSFGDRLSKAGQAFDAAANEYPAPKISGGGGDARASGAELMKLMMKNPQALAQALMSRRMA